MTRITSCKIVATGLAAGLVTGPALAQQMTISLEIPRMKVAEYHKPYVAIWIEDARGKEVATLDVWYDVDLKGDDGRKWLSDLRGWWRKAGRSATMPADGVSGPTQGPGKHRVSFAQGRGALGSLPAGTYKLRVEAAREVGGRELVTVPFAWGSAGTKSYTASGKSELGKVALTVKR